MASKYWRTQERASLYRQARQGDKPDLSTARGVLMDSARELGQLTEEAPAVTRIGQAADGRTTVTLGDRTRQEMEAATPDDARRIRLLFGRHLLDSRRT